MGLTRFLPRGERFFDYFRDGATNATEAARLLMDIFERLEDVERKGRRLRDLEHRGDEITHQILNALNTTFVTPLDRDDIQNLASELDDFIDYIEEAGSMLRLYRIEESNDRARLLARIISEQADNLAEAVTLLEKSREDASMRRHIVEIHRLENEADEVLNQALAGLYDDASDIPSLVKAIRWGEIYRLLEDATDGAEDVANALEGIVLKNA